MTSLSFSCKDNVRNIRSNDYGLSNLTLVYFSFQRRPLCNLIKTFDQKNTLPRFLSFSSTAHASLTIYNKCQYFFTII